MTDKINSSTLTKAADGTITLKISIPQAEIKKVTDEVMAETVKTADLKGFRKGKAPKKMVEEAVDKSKISEETLKRLLPKNYMLAVEEHKLRPIVNPKIHVDKMEPNSDWEFTATTAEMPEVTLGKYKEAIKDVTAKSKIVVPGKETAEVPTEAILKAVLDNVTMTIPEILVAGEADRHLAQTLDEIKKLGLTLDQYLQSTGKKPEELRADYTQKAKQELTLEFALNKIADAEKVQVETQEIDDAIAKAKDPVEKANMEQNRYLIASFIRQQKTLDFLKTL